jgi:hypothetical protein
MAFLKIVKNCSRASAAFIEKQFGQIGGECFNNALNSPANK